MKILIYDCCFDTFNQKTKYLMPLVSELSKNHELTLLGDSKFTMEQLQDKYGEPLLNAHCEYLGYKFLPVPVIAHARHLKKCRQVSALSGSFDLFINNSIDNHFQLESRAGKSIAVAHLPPDPIDRHSCSCDEQHGFFFASDLRKLNYIRSYGRLTAAGNLSSVLLERRWKKTDVGFINPCVQEPLNSKTPARQKRIFSAVKYPDMGTGRALVEAFKKFYDMGSTDDWSLDICLHTEPNPPLKTTDKLRAFKKSFGGYPIVLFINPGCNDYMKLISRSKILWDLRPSGCDKGLKPCSCPDLGAFILDAMNAQCVPVTLSAGMTQDFIENAFSGIIARKPDEVLTKTLYLQRNPGILKIMAQNAYHRSLLFSRAKYLQQFTKLIQGCPKKTAAART